ncbi:MAG TPA: response regulator [Nitrospirota bacterium]|nr:response regulator [Nitrospirota bacterium]
MKKIILCSSNPILIKNLYGMLRDEGFQVDLIEHPATAVHMVMLKKYDFIIIDSEPFGLSGEDAAEIIKTVAPDIPVLFVGNDSRGDKWQSARSPVDLEALKRTIQSIGIG